MSAWISFLTLAIMVWIAVKTLAAIARMERGEEPDGIPRLIVRRRAPTERVRLRRRPRNGASA